jgi:hypothetical protein
VKRWWSDAEQSELILKSVDDSDVVNGMGVAILGYHGLATGVLKPLATETLVDTQTVTDALNSLDLEPVIKAVAEATRPIMKEASDRYAELLVHNHHSDSVRSIERLLSSWTQNGMAWPSAVERAADVYGVPVERLGRYAHVMKSAGLTPLVRSDYADRELMTFASWFGNRENTMTDELVSKMEFVEEEHPRNELGEFSVKEKVTNLRDRRNARQARQARQAKRAKDHKLRRVEDKKANKDIQQKIEDKKKLEQKVAEQKQEVQRLEVKRTEVKRREVKRMTIANLLGDSGGKTGHYNDPIDGNGFETYLSNNPVYFMVRKEAIKEIMDSPSQSFFAGRLRASFLDVGVWDKDGFTEWLNNDPANHSSAQKHNLKSFQQEYYLCKTTLTPLQGDIGGNTKYAADVVHLAPNAQFKLISDKSAQTENFPLRYTDIDMDVVQVYLENEDTFHDAIRIEKSDFIEEEHPRNELGEFSSKNVRNLQEARDKRNARQARQARRAKSANAYKIALAAQQARKGTLADVKNSSLKQEIEQKKQEVQRREVQRKEVKRMDVQRRAITPLLANDNGNGSLAFDNLHSLVLPPGVTFQQNDKKEIKNNVMQGTFLSESDKTSVFDQMSYHFAVAKRQNDEDIQIIADPNHGPKEFDNNFAAMDFVKEMYKEKGFPRRDIDYVYSYIVTYGENFEDWDERGLEPDSWYVGLEPHDVSEPYELILCEDPEKIEDIKENGISADELENYRLDDVECLNDLLKLKSKEDTFSLLQETGASFKIGNPPIAAYHIK